MADVMRKTRIADYTPDPENANIHTERGTRMLEDSIAQVGLGRSIVVDKNGVVIAGNATQERAIDQGFENAIEVETDGNELVVVRRNDLDLLNDPEHRARLASILDNRVSEVSLTWSPEVLDSYRLQGVPLDKAWTPVELAEITTPVFEADIDLDAKPNPRQLPIDVIFTYDALYDPAMTMAIRAGWLAGTQSTQKESGKPHSSVIQAERWNWLFDLQFIDNDYFNYDHEKHVDCVQKFHPKYCTVMDVMTEAQCQKDNITYYPLEHILDWAEELRQYAEHVIVIPKYDCLDKIPDYFMLGYSVPTSHGGTPLDPELFKGRRVHLLGGSWKKQLAYMAALGDDVVSVDNNYIQKQAQYGSFVYPDGQSGNLSEDLEIKPNNPMYVALAISLGNIGAKVNELYSGGISPPSDNQAVAVTSLKKQGAETWRTTA
jgi:hypothetical protein